MTSPAADQNLPISHGQTRYQLPPGSTRFILVRHGASEAYTGKPFPTVDGHGDPALAPEGQEQARLLVSRLVREQVDAIYVTTLRRTRETLQPYLDAVGREAAVEPRLREVFLGDWDAGYFRVMMASDDPRAALLRQEGEWGHAPGAETTAQLTQRCVEALEDLHRIHVDETVLCAVHGGVIGAICRWVTGTPMNYIWGAENASIHEVIVGPGYRRLHLFNDVSHLG